MWFSRGVARALPRALLFSVLQAERYQGLERRMGEGNVGEWGQVVLVFIFHPVCGDKWCLREKKVARALRGCSTCGGCRGRFSSKLLR